MNCKIIPVINCENLNCVQQRLQISNDLNVDWLHFDIVDYTFSNKITWNNPEEIKNNNLIKNKNIELHLMTKDILETITLWINNKIIPKRVIVHWEIINNQQNQLNQIFELGANYNIEIMLAIKKETPVQVLFNYLDLIWSVQLLAVDVGFSGEAFDTTVLEKIKVLKERAPDLTIEIDGGIRPETLKQCKEYGADLFASSSYIFNSNDYKKSYNDLISAAEAADS
ncbi:MAG: hypothetical protein ACP5IC_01065 [Minisyncoccia bacterium]